MICHGATGSMKSAGFPADEPLLPGETESAAQLKAMVPHAHAVVSAPELRARQSVAALADHFSIDSAFRDTDYGRWSGKTMAEVQANEPEALIAWISDTKAAPPGGESVAAMVARIALRLEQQISAGGHTVIVTHPAIIRGAIVSILDAPIRSFWQIDVQPWSMTELTSDGRRWALRSFGRVAG
jgi:broad specificity phosphatase PhoE